MMSNPAGGGKLMSAPASRRRLIASIDPARAAQISADHELPLIGFMAGVEKLAKGGHVVAEGGLGERSFGDPQRRRPPRAARGRARAET